MKIKTFLGIALAAGSLVSCSVEDNTSEASQIMEDYTRNFIKQFGSIDPNQDWNVVEQKNVTVDLASPSHVKIYEKQGGVYRLAADYKDVTKKTITFDGLEGDDSPFLVSIDGAKYAAENGQTLTITAASKKSSTRASLIPIDGTYITHGRAETITLSSTDKTMRILAQNGVDHLKMSSVTLVAKGRLVLKKGQGVSYYPIYWNSPKKHTVGIYYHNNGELVLVPMFTDKTDNEDLSFFTSKTGTKAYPVEKDAEDCWAYTHTPTDVSPTGEWKVSYEESFKFQSKPYNINPNASLTLGIYVTVDGKTYYSEPSLNEGGKSYFANKAISGSNGTDNGYIYICFDDPSDNGGEGDHDFNDLVIYSPRDFTPVTEDEIQWTVACEDLGGTFDYDFNDIVFRVKHVSGNDYLTIYPVAAGGTLPAKLYYKNLPISEEWHQHFGNGYESTEMINTGRTEEHVIWPIRLEGIPTDWSMKTFTAGSTAKDGDFSIVVKRADGVKNTVTGPSQGAAPQMLILPYEWQWPTELTHITKAYPNFGTWGSNYTNSTWVENNVTDYVISGFGESQITAKAAKVVKVQ